MAEFLHTVVAAVLQFIGTWAGRWSSLNDMVTARWGAPVKWGMWILLALLGVVIIGRAARFVVNATMYILLPAAALSVILLVLMPCWSPMKTFPVMVGVTVFMWVSRAR
jgi:hypothetical protein